jgi:hypothetical protein
MLVFQWRQLRTAQPCPTDTLSFRIAEKRTIGWGGWTRTNTVLINSEVSYQLDHAPVVGHITIQRKSLMNVGGSRLSLLS